MRQLDSFDADRDSPGLVLNRLFIAIGLVVILAIGAAFVVPRFIQWGDYRGRMQQIAAEFGIAIG